MHQEPGRFFKMHLKMLVLEALPENCLQKVFLAGRQWLTSVTLAIQKAEIKRITVQG
jgi:hypothetical protein